MNTISLISDLNVQFVMSHGRVSLANLVDFSNFVDLFVLEDSIYSDEVAIEVCFSEGFQNYIDFPFRPIENKNLSKLVSDISNQTRLLYDLSPINYTFSIKSYDYWLSLNSTEKEKINPDEIHKLISEKILIHKEKLSPKDSRNWLLSTSKEMEDSLINLLEEVGRTDLSIMPSTRNLIPLLDSFYQIESPIFKLYNEITERHKEMAKKVLEFQRPRAIYIPPLLSILLNRCENRNEIPQRLMELRDEFTDLRQEMYYWQTEMNQKHYFKDQLELREELDNSLTKSAKKYDERRIGFYKNVSGAILDAIEEGNLKKIITKPVIAVAKEGIDLLPDKFKTKRFTGIVDIFNEALHVQDYTNLLNKIFKESVDISQYEISNSLKYVNVLKNKFNINLNMPA
jgi:hypothetical protein